MHDGGAVYGGGEGKVVSGMKWTHGKVVSREERGVERTHGKVVSQEKRGVNGASSS